MTFTVSLSSVGTWTGRSPLIVPPSPPPAVMFGWSVEYSGVFVVVAFASMNAATAALDIQIVSGRSRELLAFVHAAPSERLPGAITPPAVGDDASRTSTARSSADRDMA